jgi:hypothetical protein
MAVLISVRPCCRFAVAVLLSVSPAFSMPQSLLPPLRFPFSAQATNLSRFPVRLGPSRGDLLPARWPVWLIWSGPVRHFHSSSVPNLRSPAVSFLTAWMCLDFGCCSAFSFFAFSVDLSAVTRSLRKLLELAGAEDCFPSRHQAAPARFLFLSSFAADPISCLQLFFPGANFEF